MRADGGDRLDSETYWLGLYGEWVGVDGLYADVLAAYGYSNFDAERFWEGYHGLASFDGTSFGVAADVGQYYYQGDNLALSPYLGLHALSMRTDGYTEREVAGSEVRVDEASRSWVESAIGLKLRHRFDTGIGRFQTTGFAEWTYDFMAEDVDSALTDGVASARTARISPDETGINAGLGYSWICTDYLEIGLGYNGRFRDGYDEHSASVMLDVMF